MLDLKQLRVLPEDELGRQDIAAVNLACATGLPGAPSEVESAECLDRLDHYASCARHYTERRLPVFRHQPEVYDGCEGIFRALCVVMMLQRQFGVRYNLDKVAGDAPLDTPDTFIHGALIGNGGTCASLPVVYVAVGRRLGYPLKLAHTRGHLFCRWDEPGGWRFNIEVNNTGMDASPDDNYRTGRYYLSPEQESRSSFLKSLTPREELAVFLADRGFRWLDLGRHKEAVNSFVQATILAPGHEPHKMCTAEVLELWRTNLRRRMPPNFPQFQVNMPCLRRYPAIPEEVEKAVIGFEVLEGFLDDPKFERDVMQPLRANPHNRPPNVPPEFVVNVLR